MSTTEPSGEPTGAPHGQPVARAEGDPAAASLDARCDVIVLGAGPAGLATAWEAAQRGLHVVLLERAPTAGGMAASFEVDGVRVDHGSHRLHPVTPPEVLTRLQQLLGSDLQVRRRRGRLRLADRWVDFPLRPLDLARSMPLTWVAGVARDTARSAARVPSGRMAGVWRQLHGRGERGAEPAGRAPASYAQALRASLGPTVYDTLYAPYARKLWGLDGEQIDPEQARVRVSADTVPKVAWRVARSAWAARSSTAPRGRSFLYPRRGFGQITEALEQAARQAGAEVHTGVEVQRIVPDRPPAGVGQGATGDVEVHTSEGHRWRAAHVFSTLPIPVLARLCPAHVPDDVARAARGLRFRAMVLVYLTHAPQPATSGTAVRWSPYDAHYLPSGSTPVTRISEPANYRDSAQDPRDRSVLCAEIPCAVGDEIWSAGDGELATIVSDALRDADLPPVRGPRGGSPAVQVRRLPAVYPVYEHGFAQRLATLEDWAEALSGVTTLGRSGLFAHDNTHHALVMGRAAVAALREDGSFDDRAWRRSRDSFRDHVVED